VIVSTRVPYFDIMQDRNTGIECRKRNEDLKIFLEDGKRKKQEITSFSN